jgi:FkbM family methyltransferase
MKLFDRIFDEPELRDVPPVLVDVGAAGGVPRVWQRIARHSICVAFEPDAREATPLDATQRRFLRWIFVPALAVAEAPASGMQRLHLTRAPQCSSTLSPRVDQLQAWAFAECFDVQETRELPATTIQKALAAQGLDRVDWLKCDTQGTDLRLFRSLPDAWRERLLAVEFEPGLIDAYQGEDQLADVLASMRREPFVLAELEVVRMARRGPEGWPASARRWVRRLARGTPAWVSIRYLRDVEQRTEPLDRRALLLSWVFATLADAPDYALAVAEVGGRRFPGPFFVELTSTSTRQLKWAMLCGISRWLRRRFGPG